MYSGCTTCTQATVTTFTNSHRVRPVQVAVTAPCRAVRTDRYRRLKPQKRSLIKAHAARAARLRPISAAAADPEAELVEVELKVKGLVCDQCSSRVHDALTKLDTVKEASVSHETGLATLQVNAPSLFDAWNELPEIVDTVNSLGFEAELFLEDAVE